MKGLQRRSNFPLENCITLLLNFASIRSKDFACTLQLKIHGKSLEVALEENFLTVKMCSKIHRYQPETVPLITSFLLDVVKK